MHSCLILGIEHQGIMLFLYSSGSENGIPETLNPDLDELENTGQGQILKGFGTVSTCVHNIYPT